MRLCCWKNKTRRSVMVGVRMLKVSLAFRQVLHFLYVIKPLATIVEGDISVENSRKWIEPLRTRQSNFFEKRQTTENSRQVRQKNRLINTCVAKFKIYWMDYESLQKKYGLFNRFSRWTEYIRRWVAYEMRSFSSYWFCVTLLLCFRCWSRLTRWQGRTLNFAYVEK